MSSVYLDDLKRSVEKVDFYARNLEELLNQLVEKVKAIDPKDPTALEQIAAIKAESESASNSYYTNVQMLNESINFDVKKVPDDEKEEAKALDAQALASIQRAKATFEAYYPLRNAKAAEAQAIIDAKNKEVETNAAKTPEQTAQQNKQFASSGGDQDDKGGPTSTNSNVPIVDSSKSSTSTSATTPATATPTTLDTVTIVAKRGTEAQGSPRLRSNPLGNFSSYTYQISLYMVTPDAYNAFVLSGRKNINAFQNAVDAANQRAANAATSNSSPTASPGSPPASSSPQTLKGGGVFLIAQSGGANSNVKRAPGFEEDFYIDDLKFTQAINAKETGSATNVTNISFTVTEPYGFSFITKLRDASDALNAISKTKNITDVKNPIKQIFMLGIRFLGYDKDGKLINSKDIPGSEGDPSVNAFGLFERYFDIYIKSMKFKIDGRAVTYAIEAANVSGQMFGTKRGFINSSLVCIGETVNDVLTGNTALTPDSNQSAAETSRLAQKSVPPNSANKLGLLETLNKWEAARVGNSIEQANEYYVEFIGGAETAIKTATVASPNDTNKQRTGRSKEVTSTKKSIQANASSSTPNFNVKMFNFDNGTPIIQAIDTIIKSSSYIERALKIVNQANEELTLGAGGKNEVRWYNISSQIEIKGWDKIVGDFVYKTTYIIQPYETPVVMSTYTNNVTKYYGPNKRYEYWYTGQNSEIIKYEQQMDNTYFNVTLRADGTPESQGGNLDVPTTVGQAQPGVKTGGEAGGLSLDAQNSYVTSLYDPGAVAKAKITILGDPDYLMQTSSSSISSLYNRYNGIDGFTINPNAGQVFIEINFKEPVGYFNKNGLLKINDSIYFWKYPTEVQDDIDSRGGGMSYMLTEVISRFSKGKFEQDLTASISTFGSGSSKKSASDGTSSVESRAESNRLASKNNTLANAAAAENQSQAETNRLNRSSNASVPTLADGVSIAANTPYASLPPFGPGALDPSQLGQAGLLNSVGSINNVLDPMQKLLQNQNITIPTKLGSTQDDDAGTPTIFGRG